MNVNGGHLSGAAEDNIAGRIVLPEELTGKPVDEIYVFSVTNPFIPGKGEMKVTCSGPAVHFSKEGFENLGLASVVELHLENMHLRTAFVRIEVTEKDHPAENDQYRVNMYDKEVSPTIKLFDSLKGSAEPGIKHYLTFYLDAEARDYYGRLITLSRKAGWWSFFKIEVFLLAIS